MSDTDETAPEAGSPAVTGTPARTVSKIPLIERGEELTALGDTSALAAVDQSPSAIGKFGVAPSPRAFMVNQR